MNKKSAQELRHIGFATHAHDQNVQKAVDFMLDEDNEPHVLELVKFTSRATPENIRELSDHDLAILIDWLRIGVSDVTLRVYARLDEPLNE